MSYILKLMHVSYRKYFVALPFISLSSTKTILIKNSLQSIFLKNVNNSSKLNKLA